MELEDKSQYFIYNDFYTDTEFIIPEDLPPLSIGLTTVTTGPLQRSPPIIKEKICVLGFYDKKNLGDDMFKITLPLLFDDKYLFDFFNVEDDFQVNDYYAVILGCGDLFVPYFMDKLAVIVKNFEGCVYTIGTGFSNQEDLYRGYTVYFDYLFLRELSAVRELVKVLKPSYVKNIPDLGFLLTGPSPVLEQERGDSILLMLATPLLAISGYYEKVKECVQYLSTVGSIIAVRFNTSGAINEDDRVINDKLCRECPFIKNDATVYSVEEMLNLLCRCKFAVCSRFHGHIFATIAACPFVSICYNRKVTTYLQENLLDDLIYTNISHIDLLYHNQKNIRHRLHEIYIKNHLLFNKGDLMSVVACGDKREKNSPIEAVIPLAAQVRTACLEIAGYDLEDKNHRSLPLEQAEILSRLMCYSLTGDKESCYLYGTIGNMQSQPWMYKEMIFWISREIWGTVDHPGSARL